MSTAYTDTAQAEVKAVLDRRVEACRAKDIDRLMSLYSPGIVYFDIIPPHRFTGADEVRRNFLRWFDEYLGGIELGTHDLHVAVSGDVAFAHMLHSDSGTRRGGRNEVVWVRSTVCLQRTDEVAHHPRAHLAADQPGELERRRRRSITRPGQPNTGPVLPAPYWKDSG